MALKDLPPMVESLVHLFGNNLRRAHKIHILVAKYSESFSSFYYSYQPSLAIMTNNLFRFVLASTFGLNVQANSSVDTYLSTGDVKTRQLP